MPINSLDAVQGGVQVAGSVAALRALQNRFKGSKPFLIENPYSPESRDGRVRQNDIDYPGLIRPEPRSEATGVPGPINTGILRKPNPAWGGGLPAFPDAQSTRRVTPVQGGGGLRERWVDSNGQIFEWDSKKGEVEVYDSNKRHLGGFDPVNGRQISPADPARKTR